MKILLLCSVLAIASSSAIAQENWRSPYHGQLDQNTLVGDTALADTVDGPALGYIHRYGGTSWCIGTLTCASGSVYTFKTDNIIANNNFFLPGQAVTSATCLSIGPSSGGGQVGASPYPCGSILGVMMSAGNPAPGQSPVASSNTTADWTFVPTIASNPTVGQAMCVKSQGPPIVVSYCTSAVSASGSCTCF